MENDDLDEYEGIFDDDPVVDNLIYDKVEKNLDEGKMPAVLRRFWPFQDAACLVCLY